MDSTVSCTTVAVKTAEDKNKMTEDDGLTSAKNEKTWRSGSSTMLKDYCIAGEYIWVYYLMKVALLCTITTVPAAADLRPTEEPFWVLRCWC